MFINLNKNSKDEIIGPSRLHPKRRIIQKSTFIDHNGYPWPKQVSRVQPLTSEQVERILMRLRDDKSELQQEEGKQLVKKKVK